VWLEFVIADSGGTSERFSRRRTVPLVDNFPLMAWMSRLTPNAENAAPKTAASARTDSVTQTPSQNFCILARLGTKDIKAQVYFCCLVF